MCQAATMQLLGLGKQINPMNGKMHFKCKMHWKESGLSEKLNHDFNVVVPLWYRFKDAMLLPTTCLSYGKITGGVGTFEFQEDNINHV